MGLIRRTHELRYVLKDKDTGDVYFVVVFTLLLKEDVEKEETEESERKADKAGSDSHSRRDGSKEFQPSADDLD